MEWEADKRRLDEEDATGLLRSVEKPLVAS